MTARIRFARVPAGVFLLPVILLALAGCGGTLQEVRTFESAVIRNLGSEVNSDRDDYAPFLHGSRLYFTSNRPTVEGYIQGDDVWFSDIENGVWTRALNHGGTLNSVNDEGAPFVTPDGATMYFVQCWSEDGIGDGDIYTSTIDARRAWQRLTNAGETINSKYWDSHPYLSPDGEELYFVSDRPGGQGGTDIWVSKRLRNGKWGTPKNLGPTINTSGDEKSPLVTPNGMMLFFASDGHDGLGGIDIFVSSRDPKKGWLAPKNAGRPFNSAGDDMFFRLSAQEDTVFISSTREGGLGGHDIYSIGPNPYKDTTRYTFYLALTVQDSVRRKSVGGARVIIQTPAGGADTARADKQGRLRFETTPGAQYTFTAMADGYHAGSRTVNVPQSLGSNVYQTRVYLAPIIVDTPVVKTPTETVPTVYFEFDKADVTDENTASLNAFVADLLAPLLAAKTDFELQLDAHTDDSGSDDYNIALSRRRGAAVSRFFISKGVPRANIVMNAYGEQRPALPNDSDQGRQKNRRVEVRLLSEPLKQQ
ncbi:MAG: PD40 domain-containing protein [Ignavibacteriae bacterium]|nr:PD40 domain-containing protein [Ignavibacteriota bacterium]